MTDELMDSNPPHKDDMWAKAQAEAVVMQQILDALRPLDDDETRLRVLRAVAVLRGIELKR